MPLLIYGNLKNNGLRWLSYFNFYKYHFFFIHMRSKCHQSGHGIDTEDSEEKDLLRKRFFSHETE
jgi:hypothetical protein